MNGTSYAYAEVGDHRGGTAASLATLALGLDVTAAIAAETACRILGTHPGPPAGAWTPGTLFGPGLVAHACAISTTPADPATVWHDGPGAAR